MVLTNLQQLPKQMPLSEARCPKPSLSGTNVSDGQYQLLMFRKSKHLEVTSDSFCFLTNSAWLLTDSQETSMGFAFATPQPNCVARPLIDRASVYRLAHTFPEDPIQVLNHQAFTAATYKVIFGPSASYGGTRTFWASFYPTRAKPVPRRGLALPPMYLLQIYMASYR